MSKNVFSPRTWDVGRCKITCIQELETAWIDPAWLLSSTKEEVLHYSWLQPNFATPDGEIGMNVQAFILESCGKRILVDPCVGNGKQRPDTPPFHLLQTSFLDRLCDAGFEPETIDVVLCTHLHIDHCGWNTVMEDGRWVPTFPAARYLFAEEEVSFAMNETSVDQRATFEDSVRPIIDAGLADLIELNHQVNDEVCLIAAPGHTPAHCYVSIESQGERAVITGDALHHPVQAALPDICSVYCWNDQLAIKSRRALLERCATESIMMLGTHFPAPTSVNVEVDKGAFRLIEAV